MQNQFLVLCLHFKAALYTYLRLRPDAIMKIDYLTDYNIKYDMQYGLLSDNPK